MKLAELRTAIAFYQGKIRVQIKRDGLHDNDYLIFIGFGADEWRVAETGAGEYRTFKSLDAAVRIVHQLGLAFAEVDTRPRS